MTTSAVNKILSLPRRAKRAIFLVTDLVILVLSLYAACALRYGTAFPVEQILAIWPLFPIAILTGVPILIFQRLPFIKLAAFEIRAMQRVAVTSALLTIVAMATSYVLNLSAPRSVPIIYGGFFFLGACMVRVLALQLIVTMSGRHNEAMPVLIYGAGSAGTQLAGALDRSHQARTVAFVDDNPSLRGLVVNGVPVYLPTDIPKLIKRHTIKQILIALPSVELDKQRKLARSLMKTGVEVRVLPSFLDLMSGRGNLNALLQPVAPDALLGRDKVELNTPEIAKAYAGRVVLVTGAGGSIGSELCQQLIDCRPDKIVLFEQSEFALYQIERRIADRLAGKGIGLVARLGSVTNPDRIRAVLADQNVDIVIHAAAYKHVPLVEENELEGARNNVLGTRIAAEAAIAHGCERFVLVSTDKAVRPTNIMGATKRMAELVIQDLQSRSAGTRLSMVRFGNVLGSSGSVLPLFSQQIASGGPVTVTHPDVTRFFMTIPEAARLVLLAGAYSTGGDVFVLDMGQPQKIVDLARTMIELSGRTVRDDETGKGDISIEFTGLRPGEKLYEELLIDDDSLRSTPHPKIMRAEEYHLSEIEVAQMLRNVATALAANDTEQLRAIVQSCVAGYSSMTQGSDKLSV